MTPTESRPGAPPRPRINITVPPVYMAPPIQSAQYSPAHYFQHYHQQHQNPLYQPPPPSSPSRISVAIDGTNQPPDYPDYYSMYPAKAGEFVFKQFEGFKDFTMNTAKSGLGVGEKSVFWLYTKITKWSRNWFTHIFLFLMLFLYSVAGAALFIAVEGDADNEIFPTDFALDDNVTGTYEKKMETNVNHAKKILAKNLRILALDREKLENPDPDLWEGRAINLVEEYSTVLYEAYKQGSFENKQNKKTWSFWNAVFYCGTIYTTIGNGMLLNFRRGNNKPIIQFERKYRLNRLVHMTRAPKDSIIYPWVKSIWTKKRPLVKFDRRFLLSTDCNVEIEEGILESEFSTQNKIFFNGLSFCTKSTCQNFRYDDSWIWKNGHFYNIHSILSDKFNNPYFAALALVVEPVSDNLYIYNESDNLKIMKVDNSIRQCISMVCMSVRI